MVRDPPSLPFGVTWGCPRSCPRNEGGTAPLEPQEIGKLECLCRVGARAPCSLQQTHPEGFPILGQKWSLLPSFFLPLEYKDFFFRPAGQLKEKKLKLVKLA